MLGWSPAATAARTAQPSAGASDTLCAAAAVEATGAAAAAAAEARFVVTSRKAQAGLNLKP
jgi:hypothetical protein